MKTASLVMGVLSLFGMFFGFIPCLGAFNWINIPFAVIGLVISIVAYFQEDNQPKGNALAGAIMCAAAAFFGFIRLFLGGGLI